ncbi:hypothetical protein BV898_09320 [Hypsibius exemplaris]|uniref:Uncharacterized protein n=1 Tax=Hypsibius exemplaris TaxID=2072580 RepID=A0A1W0WN54_HYPEX|nr:hypothetical protein BV898_09320 [Hypsibius exemplaris]
MGSISICPIFKAFQLTLSFFGIFCNFRQQQQQPSHKGPVKCLAATIVTFVALLMVTVPICIEFIILYVMFRPAPIDPASSYGFDILRILNQLRYIVDRIPSWVIFIVLSFRRDKMAKLLYDLSIYFRRDLSSSTPHPHLRRRLLMYLGVTVAVILGLHVVPEAVHRSGKASSPVYFGKDYNATYHYNIEWFRNFANSHIVLYQVLFIHGFNLYSTLLLCTTLMLAGTILFLLTGSVRHLVTEADNIVKAMRKGAAVGHEDFLAFRSRSREVAVLFGEFNEIFSLVLIVVLGANLVLIAATCSWIFDSSLVTDGWFRVSFWVAFLLAKSVVLTHLCVFSTETADLLLESQKRMAVEYDSYWIKKNDLNSSMTELNEFILNKALLEISVMSTPAASVGGFGYLRKESLFAILSTCAGLILFLYDKQSNYNKAQDQSLAARPGDMCLVGAADLRKSLCLPG